MRRTTVLWAGLALFATTTLENTAHAAWSPDASFGGVPVSAVATGQTEPCITSDGAGGCFIAWTDVRSGNYDIYAQRLSAQGVPLWGANGVPVCTQAAAQTEPRIIRSGSGEAIVVWKDDRNGSSDIYVQRLGASGTRQWNLNGLAVCLAAGDQDSHVLVDDGSSGAVIAWRDVRTAETDIYAQRILFNGVAAWTVNGIGICTAPREQSEPALLATGSGLFYLAWSDRRNDLTSGVDLYCQRINGNGAPDWAVGGTPIVTSDGQQSGPQLVSDGLNGAYVVWNDGRNTVDYDIYAQHILSDGTTHLPLNGRAICTSPFNQLAPRAVEDGSGGAIIVWQDERAGLERDVYAAHLTAGGLQNWAAEGTPVCTAEGDQPVPAVAPDGSGGAVILWTDTRGGDYDVYAQRMTRSGSPVWTANGIVVCSALRNQVSLNAIVNPDGSAIAVWLDQRDPSYDEVYAQRVDRYGYLGSPEPRITQVRDVAGDQGGFAKVTWSASYLDADPTYAISEYRVFRSAPVSLAQAAAAHRALTHDSDVAVETGALLVLPNAAADIGWEYVGTQAAEAFTSYSRVVATTGDSTAAGNKRTYFLVEARSGSSPASPRWASLPDSGYSVDNVAPAAPAALTGQYAAGATHLLWQPNADADLDHYAIYRGTSTAFTPSPANRVTLATLPGFTDAAGSPYVYKVTAIDIHGNESPVATLIPSGTLGVGDGAANATLEFAAPSPNPARGTTTLRFSLTKRGPVTLALYDAAGRRVTTVADGVMDAGMHSATLQLRDASGRELPAGLYLARFEAEGRTLTRRLVAVR